MIDVSGPAAFSAGLLSFLSPCVLPLVPGYISFMSGLTLEELADRNKAVKRAGGWESFAFVLGFTLVFTALGAGATYVGGLLNAHLTLFTKAAGALIILFGLHLMGIFPVRLFYLQKQASLSQFSPGMVGSFLMGIAFAFGWTPCVGPILSTILAMAAVKQSVFQGMGLLVLYSLGLGLPFVATGFAVHAFLGFFRKYRPFIRYGEWATGSLLIALGVLMLFTKGGMTHLIRFVPDYFKRFAQ